MPRRVPPLMLTLALLLYSGPTLPARAQDDADAPAVVQGSLHELRDKRLVLLVVSRSAVVDAREPGRAIIEAAYRTTTRQSRSYRLTYNTIARKLNEYMRRHRSMSAVEHASEADFIIFFNLLEYRRTLGVYYPYGETYVISNHPPASGNPPRILYRSRKVMWAEDSVKELIRDLKAARGER